VRTRVAVATDVLLPGSLRVYPRSSSPPR
jgi:hypothetical protein